MSFQNYCRRILLPSGEFEGLLAAAQASRATPDMKAFENLRYSALAQM